MNLDKKINKLKKELKDVTVCYNPSFEELKNVFGEIKVNVSDITIKSTKLLAKLNLYNDIKLFKKLNVEAEYVDIVALMRLRFTKNYNKIEYIENFVSDIYADSYMEEINIITNDLKKNIKEDLVASEIKSKQLTIL
ncbi:hypothetical protein [Mesoflavibacter sp. SCSIO 43206]|uniref:hypothetical protein n=1 Tax=Mesoflavibacter sp. SCSIO 43206 TaxID=2779362 RepID=UPI001CA95032|nr:hypothetical protein [Mesoflavibacter sp. SCSIO 43206]UAB75140.1 hypothetical protein INR78_12220 [Mesoflavibacter sp. SCSIO 43206]